MFVGVRRISQLIETMGASEWYASVTSAEFDEKGFPTHRTRSKGDYDLADPSAPVRLDPKDRSRLETEYYPGTGWPKKSVEYDREDREIWSVEFLQGEGTPPDINAQLDGLDSLTEDAVVKETHRTQYDQPSGKKHDEHIMKFDQGEVKEETNIVYHGSGQPDVITRMEYDNHLVSSEEVTHHDKETGACLSGSVAEFHNAKDLYSMKKTFFTVDGQGGRSTDYVERCTVKTYGSGENGKLTVTDNWKESPEGAFLEGSRETKTEKDGEYHTERLYYGKGRIPLPDKTMKYRTFYIQTGPRDADEVTLSYSSRSGNDCLFKAAVSHLDGLDDDGSYEDYEELGTYYGPYAMMIAEEADAGDSGYALESMVQFLKDRDCFTIESTFENGGMDKPGSWCVTTYEHDKEFEFGCRPGCSTTFTCVPDNGVSMYLSSFSYDEDGQCIERRYDRDLNFLGGGTPSSLTGIVMDPGITGEDADIEKISAGWFALHKPAFSTENIRLDIFDHRDGPGAAFMMHYPRECPVGIMFDAERKRATLIVNGPDAQAQANRFADELWPGHPGGESGVVCSPAGLEIGRNDVVNAVEKIEEEFMPFEKTIEDMVHLSDVRKGVGKALAAHGIEPVEMKDPAVDI